MLNARPEQRREQQYEQPRRQYSAAQPWLRGLGDLLGAPSGERPADADRHQPEHPQGIEQALARDVAWLSSWALHGMNASASSMTPASTRRAAADRTLVSAPPISACSASTAADM